MLVSLAMIVKNEEETLAHCLESVKPIVDEMVIVDTGSTDKTIEIAKGFGASVHHFQWCDDFSAARNESLKHCRGEWVLVMDADEAIDPLDYEKIKNACTNPFADAYEMKCRYYSYDSTKLSQSSGAVPNTSPYSEGRHLPFYAENTALRLAKMFDGLVFSNSVHESMRPSLTNCGKTIKPLDAVLHHYGDLFKDRVQHKINYYLMLATKEAEKNPQSMEAHFNVMQQALDANMWDLALRSADECLRVGQNVYPHVLFGKASALKELGRHEEAIDQLNVLLIISPGHAPAMLLKSFSLVELGDVESGRQTTQRAIELQPSFVLARIYLSHLDIKEGKMDAARKTLAEALEIAPSEPKIYNQMLHIELLEGNHLEATKIAERAIKECPGGGDGNWESCVYQYYSQMAEHELARGGFDNARQLALKGLESVPNEPRLYDLLIKIEMGRDNLQQAAQDALKGLQNCQASSPLWYRLAAVYLGKVGERHTAKSILEMGLKAFPGDPDLVRLMGII
ncbi:MAG: glycosyltransferase [Holophagales bacterium]|jgi:tetratricopeptide (TPR) repeat protein|nr:glycosyltransferase [Holophagales bacterium]